MSKLKYSKWEALALKFDARNFHSRGAFYRGISKLASIGYLHVKISEPEQYKKVEKVLLDIRKIARQYKGW